MSTEVSRTPIERFVDRLLQWKLPLLILAEILMVCSTWIARDLQFDQRIESLYAADDPHLRNFLESKQLFGGDEFLMVAWREPDLIETDDKIRLAETAEERILAFEAQLNAIEGINPESTRTLENALRFPWGRKRVLGLIEGILINGDWNITAILLRLTPEEDNEKRAATYREVRRVADAHDPPAFVTGEPLHIHDMFRYVQEDGSVLFRFSFGLLSVVLLVLFRSIRWFLIPAAIVFLSIKLTEAVLVLSGTQLSMVSTIMNSLVSIIGVATVTHLAVQYRRHRVDLDPAGALHKSLCELLKPIFWTCATTAAGFLALLASEITPVRSFGMMMSLASMMVFVSVLLIVPGGILLLGRFQNDPRSAPAEKHLVELLQLNTTIVGRFPKLILFAGAIGIGIAAWGFKYLRVETDFSKNFRHDSPLVQSLNFVERELGGSTSMEVNFPAPETLNEEYLDQVDLLADQLRELHDEQGPYLTSVSSLNDGLKLVPALPFVLNSPRKRLDRIKVMQPEFEPTLYNSDELRMRLVMRTHEAQSAERKNAIINRVTEVARESFPEAKVTGIFVLLTFLIDSLMSDQIVSFSYAALLIFLLMTFAFRSLRMALIGLIPNLLPIVLVIGGMGWAQIPINIATAMITCVSMGLTVDSSIHFLLTFRREYAAGRTFDEAIALTTRDVGRALIFANLALVAGFSVLTFSHFIPLVYFGMLVCVAMGGGLIGNLVLLPIMLRLIYARKKLADAQ